MRPLPENATGLHFTGSKKQRLKLFHFIGKYVLIE